MQKAPRLTVALALVVALAWGLVGTEVASASEGSVKVGTPNPLTAALLATEYTPSKTAATDVIAEPCIETTSAISRVIFKYYVGGIEVAATQFVNGKKGEKECPQAVTLIVGANQTWKVEVGPPFTSSRPSARKTLYACDQFSRGG